MAINLANLGRFEVEDPASPGTWEKAGQLRSWTLTQTAQSEEYDVMEEGKSVLYGNPANTMAGQFYWNPGTRGHDIVTGGSNQVLNCRLHPISIASGMPRFEFAAQVGTDTFTGDVAGAVEKSVDLGIQGAVLQGTNP